METRERDRPVMQGGSRVKQPGFKVQVSVTETELFKDMVKLLKELHETGNDEQKQKIERFIGEKLETNRG